MKPIWLEEYIKSVANTICLKEKGDSTSIRQAFILLDNSFEQYMTEYVNTGKKPNDRKEFDNYHKLLNAFKKEVKISEALYKRLMEFHDVRNSMYHKKNYLVISHEWFDEYLEIVLNNSHYKAKELRDLIYVCYNSKIKCKINRIEKDYIKNRRREREFVNKSIKDIIVQEFSMVGNKYIGELLLGENPGATLRNFEEIKSVIEGYVKICNSKIYVLELIDSNTENPFHSFIISKEDSHNWKCFVDSFWSREGDGNDRWIRKIRNLINKNSKRVIYKRSYIREGLLSKRFD